MAQGVKDRVRETATAVGSPLSFNLPNTATAGGYQTFLAGWGASGTGFYAAVQGSNFEVGRGTINAGGTWMTRDVIHASSNGGSSVAFAADTAIDLFEDIPAYLAEFLNQIEDTVASAGTTDIGAPDSGNIVISGTTTITSFGTARNKLRRVRHTGALTLTNGATLVLPGSANIAVAAGDSYWAVSDDTATPIWYVFGYTRGANKPITWPGTTTDNTVPRFDGTGGNLQTSGFTVDDSNHISSFGGNIKFPATQAASADANTFDDYEEGTWTPTFTFGTPGNLVFTYAVRLGGYRKLAGYCHVLLYVASSVFTHTTAAGIMEVNGLPFASVGAAASQGGGAWQGITFAGVGDVAPEVWGAESRVRWAYSGTGIATGYIGFNHMPTGGNVVLRSGVSYHVA